MNPNTQARGPTTRNLTVDRALRVLEAFLGSETQLGVVELSRQLDLDKSVIHRILTTLAGRRFIEQDPLTRRYQIGLRVWELGQRYRTSHQLRNLAEAELTAITRKHPYTTGYLSTLDTADVVVVTTVRGPGPINLYSDPSTHLIAELTTTGRVLLAWLPQAQLATLVDPNRHGGPAEMPAVSMTDLAAALAAIRERGYGTNQGGPYAPPGTGTVAVAIRAPQGQAMAALTVDFLIGPETEKLWSKLPGELTASAARIEHVINAEAPNGGHQKELTG
ncbi:MAG: IclR family transcriptional regulator [Micrococcales bacterium]|nr:IclR family transcriptional regulator [Micrococcales bacterium]